MNGPPTVGRRVQIRPVYPSDHEYVYALANTPEIAPRWRYRGETPSFETFVRELWQGTLAHFIIERKVNGQALGYVQAFDASERNGWCYFAVMVDPTLFRSGWVIEGVALFVNYVFTLWNFSKLYAVLLEPAYNDLHGATGSWFVTEGCFKEHEWYDGAYRDLYLVTLRRDAWEKSGPALIAKLTANGAQ